MRHSEKPDMPEKKESPKKVVLRIVVQRHGPKRTTTGEKDETADYFEAFVLRGFDTMDVQDGQGLVRVATSPIERAVKTASIVSGEISEMDNRPKDKLITEKTGLATPFKEAKEGASEAEKVLASDLKKIIEIQKFQ